MNNLQIIANEVVEKGIYTAEQVEGFLAEGELPIHTFDVWAKAGYIVRKGQKARLITRLWKPAKVKNKESGETEETYVKVKSFLFTADQVAPATQTDAP